MDDEQIRIEVNKMSSNSAKAVLIGVLSGYCNHREQLTFTSLGRSMTDDESR